MRKGEFEAAGNTALIEDFGVRVGGVMGWPPIAGRMAGMLMLSGRAMTLTELQEALSASKGSVSETTRVLIASGTVERLKEPGHRGHFYRWRADAWIGCIQHQLSQTTELLKFSEASYEQSSGMPELQRHRLMAMRDFYRFMTARLADLLADFSAQAGEEAPVGDGVT